MHGTNPVIEKLPGFAGGTIDRVDHIRSNPAKLADAFVDPAARLLVLDGLEPVEVNGHLLLEPLAADAHVADHVLLGIDPAGQPIFARLVADLGPNLIPTPRSRAIAGLVPAAEVALYGTARSLVHWHARHRFCSVCGGPTQPVKAGWSRRCDLCAAEHFPRTDPVVIMLVTHGNDLLLGRSPGWPEGMYSCLAGFIEPGETVEAAVRREVFEESGVRLGPVEYLASQPWPFPASLMIGCRAQALDTAITLDPAELEDALWISREDLLSVFAGENPAIRPPRKGSIAQFLLSNWLADRLD